MGFLFLYDLFSSGINERDLLVGAGESRSVLIMKRRSECLTLYGSFQIEKGIFSENPYVTKLAILTCLSNGLFCSGAALRLFERKPLFQDGDPVSFSIEKTDDIYPFFRLRYGVENKVIIYCHKANSAGF